VAVAERAAHGARRTDLAERSAVDVGLASKVVVALTSLCCLHGVRIFRTTNPNQTPAIPGRALPSRSAR